MYIYLIYYTTIYNNCNNLICLANNNYPQMDNPPPYAPPEGPYYMADVPYGVPPPGYYGWMPSTAAFPNAPPRNYLFIHNTVDPAHIKQLAI